MEKVKRPKSTAELYKKFLMEFNKDWPDGCENEFWDKPLVGTYRGVTFVTNNVYMFEMFYRIQSDDAEAENGGRSRGGLYIESQRLEPHLMNEVLKGEFKSGIYLTQQKIEPIRSDLKCSHGCGRMLILAKTPEHLEKIFDAVVCEHIRSVQISLNGEPKGSLWEQAGIWPYKNPYFPSLSAEVVLNGRPYPHETSDLFKEIKHPNLGGQMERLSHSLRLARLRHERENLSL